MGFSCKNTVSSCYIWDFLCKIFFPFYLYVKISYTEFSIFNIFRSLLIGENYIYRAFYVDYFNFYWIKLVSESESESESDTASELDDDADDLEIVSDTESDAAADRPETIQHTAACKRSELFMRRVKPFISRILLNFKIHILTVSPAVSANVENAQASDAACLEEEESAPYVEGVKSGTTVFVDNCKY